MEMLEGVLKYRLNEFIAVRESSMAINIRRIKTNSNVKVLSLMKLGRQQFLAKRLQTFQFPNIMKTSVVTD